MPRPDFLIVGAPKCGTTALNSFLAEHPELYVAKKEFHHFGRDLRPDNYTGERWDVKAYESLFDEAEEGQLTGEASVWYLFSETAALEIYARNPDAKIIIMLRNPVEMMYSLYNMFIWLRDWTPNGVVERETDRVLSFEEGLDTQEARQEQLHAEGDPEAVEGRRTLRCFHTDVAMYSSQVARYLNVFPRKQVHVIFHDDLKRDPDRTYQTVLRFLGVEEDFTPTFRKVNASRDIKNVRLHRLMNDHGSLPWLRRALRTLAPRGARKALFQLLWRRNVQTKPQEPMREATRRRLQTHFRPDVERLGALLGEDLLARWYPAESIPGASVPAAEEPA